MVEISELTQQSFIVFCFEFQIEEEIEEITEEYHENEHLPTTSSRSVTKSGPWLSAAPSMHSVDCILAELNSQQVDKKNGVPFPEFGVDIILHHRESKLSYIFTEFPSGPSIPFFLCRLRFFNGDLKF